MRCSRSGLDDVQLAADAGEGIDRLVQVLARMRRADLGADAGLVLRHDGEEEPDRVAAFLEQPLRELLRQRRVVEDRKGVVSGKRVSVSVDVWGRRRFTTQQRLIKKSKT